MSRPLIASLPLLVALACGTPSSEQSADLGSSPGDLAVALQDAGADAATASAQLPPIGSAMELEQWLATGAYKQWACEKDPHAARAGSAHTANRICSNDLLSGSASGEFPVGAASVKELFDGGGQIVGYAVGVRTKTGAVDSAWFWYERVNTTTYANGAGVPLCANCHRGAPRDYIFTQVRR
jgi:hypothetical protein